MEKQAAYTKPAPVYPGYVNVTRDAADNFTITVRGDARESGPGALASLTLSESEWRDFRAELAGRL
ncbi:hypothetical protein [Phenylobacterium deserti]|uniref:DUF397 domain-containing protein n=1 Tax=Phenylobacterium deserti TaxID=1914756 RepID=A0A328ABX3_9CAUL|nr:hypothetical protein [Phenylobacterium deserti]RAK52151.1 hypothetical protein DJ018_13425 [Phenylobacterium deserti]